ncbi:MAG: DNA repair protein RecN [Porphyromonadaceae bacterium]|nr:MAG: DNA repair protein RecN [Porphyromonadaceae bacterium]
MLISLSIRNYALITSLDVEFRTGLNMITGETGAGKSILLGALSLLLGNRADSQVLKDKSQKCLVEGTFDLSGLNIQDIFIRNDLDYDNPTIFRREINPQGKSRAFINDTPVTLTVLRDLGTKLVDIHSQHQNLLISDPVYALHVVDQYGRLQIQLDEYLKKYERYKQLTHTLHQRQEKLNRAKADQDYLEFQLAQLDEAKLSADEQDILEQEQLLLEHADDIQLHLSEGVQILHESEDSILSHLKQILSGLQSIAPYYPEITDPVSRFQASYIELQELSRELNQLQGHVESDPVRLHGIIERLDMVNSLEKKHQVTSIGELLDLQTSYRERLNTIQTSDDEILTLKAELEKVTSELTLVSQKLSEERRKIFPDFEKNVTRLVRELGMPNGRFEVHHEKSEEFSQDGIDEVRFWFSANKNQPAEELSIVASCGETSRLMLSIKSLISNSLAIPTVIFDEIDSGVSGDIADKVGNLISRISKGRQVLNITHLPQVASKGDHHYKVFKYDDVKTTHTTMKLLTTEERVTELAQMLSGENITPEAIQNARVLLNI